MELLRNLQKMSAMLFIVTGFIFLGARLLALNNYFAASVAPIAKFSFLPWIAMGLLYGAVSLKNSLVEEGQWSSLWNLTIIIIGLLLFFGISAAYLLFPDKT